MDNIIFVRLILAAIIASLLFAYVILRLVDLYYLNKAIAIVQKKCNEYVEKICDQSNPKTKPPSTEFSPIRGGKQAPEGKLPHMAFVGIYKEPGRILSAVCSGSLISEYFVMTAAHCLINMKKDQISVILGAVNITNGIEFNIDVIYVHPEYDNYIYERKMYDIGLLKLDKKVEFNWKIKPICLNTDINSILKADITASGWGTDEKNEKVVRLLQVVDLYINNTIRDKCLKAYGETLYFNMVCAGHLTEYKSTCPGDSGGPLQIFLKNGCPNTYEQIGITSASRDNCSMVGGDYPLLMFTKVQLVLPWIVGIVWPD